MRDELIEVYGYLAKLAVSVLVAGIPAVAVLTPLALIGAPGWVAVGAFFGVLIVVVPVPLVWLSQLQDRWARRRRAGLEITATQENRRLDEQDRS